MNTNTSTYKNLVKSIVKDDLLPLFNNNCFKKRGNAFYKIEKDLVQFINLERFRFNTHISFNFWFNVKIYHGNYDPDKKIDEKVLLTDGFPAFYKKIGYLWDEPNYMYQISERVDTLQLREKIVSDFENIVFPFYERIKTFDSLVEFLIHENQRNNNNFFAFTIAVLLAKAGETERSKEFFRQSPGEAADIKQFAKSLGVYLDQDF